MVLDSWWLNYKQQPHSRTRQFYIFILFPKWVLKVLIITLHCHLWIHTSISHRDYYNSLLFTDPLLLFLPPLKIHLWKHKLDCVMPPLAVLKCFAMWFRIQYENLSMVFMTCMIMTYMAASPSSILDDQNARGTLVFQFIQYITLFYNTEQFYLLLSFFWMFKSWRSSYSRFLCILQFPAYMYPLLKGLPCLASSK